MGLPRRVSEIGACAQCWPVHLCPYQLTPAVSLYTWVEHRGTWEAVSQKPSLLSTEVSESTAPSRQNCSQHQLAPGSTHFAFSKLLAFQCSWNEYSTLKERGKPVAQGDVSTCTENDQVFSERLRHFTCTQHKYTSMEKRDSSASVLKAGVFLSGKISPNTKPLPLLESLCSICVLLMAPPKQL